MFALLNRRLGGNPWRQRMFQTCLEQLIAFLGIDKGPAADPAALIRLRSHCRNAILSASTAYYRMITAEFRGTGCSRAEEFPSAGPEGLLNLAIRKCSRDDKRCRVDEFFRENITHSLEIADYIGRVESASDELHGIREEILGAIDDAARLLDGRGCMRLADAMIAVDGREMDEFAANNDREWTTLAAALGKPLLNPVARTRQGPQV